MYGVGFAPGSLALDGDDKLQTPIKPLAVPTARSLGESQQKQVQSVDGGLASKAGA